jgi:hypothetical protein
MKARLNSSSQVVEVVIPDTSEAREVGERMLSIVRHTRRVAKDPKLGKAAADWEELIEKLLPKVVAKAA